MSRKEIDERIESQVVSACEAVKQHAAAIAAAAGTYKTGFCIRIEIDPASTAARINYDLDALGIPDEPDLSKLYMALGVEPKEAEK